MTDGARSIATLDLVGGALALDFANTINSRIAPQHDYLAGYRDLVAWATRAGGVSADLGGRLVALATRDPREAKRVAAAARQLREAIYGTFSRLAAAEDPAAEDVRAVLRAYGAAAGRATVSGSDRGLEVDWPGVATLAGILDPIAFSAGQILLASDRPPVKECPGCGWLFLDRSRNLSRRWCNMQTCGSRDKMRRYHRERRPARGSAGPRSREDRSPAR